jgi:hypothetical protein
MTPNRFSLIFFCAGALVLAACGGQAEPTLTPTVEGPPSNTPDASAEPTVVSPFGTIALPPTAGPVIGPSPEAIDTEEGVQPGGAGTLVAVGTADPELPDGFDQIILVRTGGPLAGDGQPLEETIILERDGTMSRNGASGQALPSTVADIGTRIDAINFFGIQSNFIGAIPREGATPYLYQLFVRKGFSERTITAQAGLIPAELDGLIAAILAEGLKIERP